MNRTVERVEFTRQTVPKPLRVAAYARVSSDKDAMHHSMSAQVSYFSNLIQSHPGWQYVGVYADEAKTGTKDTRENFARLLSDCRAGKVDTIITKSVSRFARNTVMLLETVRELKGLGIDVFFEEQNIHTVSGDGELILSILASFAQAESQSVSENQKWRIKKNFEEGKPWNGTMLGYRYSCGKLVTIPHEASIVKRIFAEYLAGKGYYLIAKELNAEGVFPKSGLPWRGPVIAKMLKNYNYTGNLLLQKTYRENYITKCCKKNRGEYPQYLAEETHEAIIDISTFNAVQAEMACRAERFTPKEQAEITYPLTGLIRCGHCGKNFNRKTVRGEKIWICSTYNKKGKEFCHMKQIPESTLNNVILDTAGSIERLECITIGEDNRLTFHFADGTVMETTWQDRSRSAAWTDEMKELARQKTLKRKMQNG